MVRRQDQSQRKCGGGLYVCLFCARSWVWCALCVRGFMCALVSESNNIIGFGSSEL
jgi:hypothetical protein